MLHFLCGKFGVDKSVVTDIQNLLIKHNKRSWFIRGIALFVLKSKLLFINKKVEDDFDEISVEDVERELSEDTELSTHNITADLINRSMENVIGLLSDDEIVDLDSHDWAQEELGYHLQRLSKDAANGVTDYIDSIEPSGQSFLF